MESTTKLITVVREIPEGYEVRLFTTEDAFIKDTSITTSCIILGWIHFTDHEIGCPDCMLAKIKTLYNMPMFKGETASSVIH